MLIIAGWLRVSPQGRDAYVAECVPIVEAAHRADGCLDFAITADSVRPDRVNVYERWESDELLHRFRDSGPEGAQQDRILAAEVHKYRISGVEAP
ncbi:antibiotic biosynthesis monooxygenase [Stackebrandtia endophytica]|uniref:Antibiotic biosynthesis monooxygenase n=1 Tax=Stackebrandtia endophytica TaxID=1496996 RepID=A0A543ASS7_9ACTN|nr:antibiotic biosynthesis monooxygenase [Stackebrandtia endophytica]TQL75641.1 antibiotic biosynthesis monooxygenase [Stackebrandtia endophytica]